MRQTKKKKRGGGGYSRVLGINSHFTYYFAGETGWRKGPEWASLNVCGLFPTTCGNPPLGGYRGCKDHNVSNRAASLNWGVWSRQGRLEERLCSASPWHRGGSPWDRLFGLGRKANIVTGWGNTRSHLIFYPSDRPSIKYNSATESTGEGDEPN